MVIVKTDAVKKEVLEKRLAILIEQFVALNNQYNREGDSDERIRLKGKIDDLSVEMKEVEDALNKLEDCDKDLNQIHLDLEKRLPKIDFQQAINLVENITINFGREGGAAFFILDNSYSMAGELCIFRIREQFQDETSTSSFKHIKVELTYVVQNELGLLEGIGKYVNVYRQPEDSTEIYIKKIINIICQSLQSGSVIFIEIKKLDHLLEPEIFLPWFLDNFWVPLIKEYRRTTDEKKLRRVKCIAIIDFESPLSQECISLPCYCNHDNFEFQKLVRLPLNRWTEEDIREWLEKYIGLPGSQIDTMATQIYSKTMNGVPLMVCEAIKKEFT